MFQNKAFFPISPQYMLIAIAFSFLYFLLFNAAHAFTEVEISDKSKEDSDDNLPFENFTHKFNSLRSWRFQFGERAN